jgi:uncharacterized glyoxalase superfamily protein PhnB
MISETRFVIGVPDLEVSAAYYRDVLDFELRDLAPGWRMYARGACIIMAGEEKDALHPSELGDHNYFAYLVEGDIDAYHDRVVAAGAKTKKPLRYEPWGMREFCVETVDGHRIMFGQRIA